MTKKLYFCPLMFVCIFKILLKKKGLMHTGEGELDNFHPRLLREMAKQAAGLNLL